MNTTPQSLVDQCLIATPSIKDPLFASSIVYMCEHSEQGSLGTGHQPPDISAAPGRFRAT
jgi:putative AlgH/UPF0301 family transcriptional regulator